MKGIRISQSITNRQDESLKLFFKEISKIPLLTSKEELEIAKKIKNGDELALNKLVVSNLRFVVSVAKQYQGKGLPLVDLIQAGAIGLIEGAKKFDHERGYKFISFAVWWIRQSIIKSLSNQCRTIRIPTNQLLCINKINKITEKYEQEQGRVPSIEELENETELNISKINSVIYLSNKSVSLDTPFKNDEVNNLLDIIPDDNIDSTDSQMHDNDRIREINRILNTLSPRDGDIIKMTFGIGMNPMPNEDIGKRFGIGAERVRQLMHNALKRLRKNHINEFKELL